MTVISLVLARADNGVIGNNGGIPWRIHEDMKHFKAITMGHPIVMGRKTWDSFPKKPLPGRTNIVITRYPNWKADGAVVAHSFEEALAAARSENPSEICVVGGADIYLAAMGDATRVHLTEIHAEPEGDVSLPLFEPVAWRERAREDHETPDGLRYSYVTLDRA